MSPSRFAWVEDDLESVVPIPTIPKSDIPGLPDDLAEFLDELDDEALAEAMRPVLLDTIAHFGQIAIPASTFPTIAAGIAFDVRQPEVELFLREFAGERIKDLVGTGTRRALGEALAKARAEGARFDQIVSGVREAFGDMSKARAEMIARTETTRAAGFGTQFGMAAASVERKMWLSSRDAWVRDTHQALDGQIKPADEPFEIGGSTAMFPGDFGKAGMDINCRCMSIALPDEAAAAAHATKDQRDAAWKSLSDQLLDLERRMASAVREGFALQEMRLVSKLARRMGVVV